METKSDIDIKTLLEQFRLTSFRKGQADVIRAVLSGSDTLCIMPTGGGKSLCYQLPAIAKPGLTVVVSPLIALMKDQVDALQSLGLPATYINSSLSPADQRHRIENLRAGQYKLVYIAPERLRSSAFMRTIREQSVGLLAVDEAHCISQWGHDFRPDYAKLGHLRERMGSPQTIALTATATELVREDICKVLDLQTPEVFVTGFSRDNLLLSVESPGSNSARDQRLVEFLKVNKGSGIVYASTRKNCEHVVEMLTENLSRSVEYYHAGLTPERRKVVQEQFMSGDTPIIVATNAFGMGIDKRDLRFVIHYNLPGSIEAYYQEAGRAGRDGEDSKCLLLYSFQDRFVQEFFIENSYPSRDIVKQVYEYLVQFDHDPIEMTLLEIKDELGLSISTEGISNCENLLEQAGAIERLDSQQNMAAIKIDSDQPSLVDFLPKESKAQRKVLRALERRVGSMRGERVFFRPDTLAKELDMKWPAVSRAIKKLTYLDPIDYVPPFRGRAIHLLTREPFDSLAIDFRELERRKQAEGRKLERMIRFASTKRCRQLEILEYFGDPDLCNCSRCDNCVARALPATKKLSKYFDADACRYAVQVALSGAARTHGRIGKTLIAQMLSGSTAKKVKNLGLQKLTTFGLLRPLKQTEVVELVETLIEFGYLSQSENTKFRPTVTISPMGKQLMTGQVDFQPETMLSSGLLNSISSSFRGKRPKRTAERASEHKDNINVDASGNSVTLEEANSDLDAEIEMNSIATAKDLIPPQEVCDRQTQHIRLDFAETEPKPPYYWTWRLLSDGYSCEEIQQIRGLAPSVVFEHAIQAANDKLTIKPRWLLDASLIAALEKFCDKHANERTALAISKLPPEISAAQFLYYQKCLDD